MLGPGVTLWRHAVSKFQNGFHHRVPHPKISRNTNFYNKNLIFWQVISNWSYLGKFSFRGFVTPWGVKFHNDPYRWVVPVIIIYCSIFHLFIPICRQVIDISIFGVLFVPRALWRHAGVKFQNGPYHCIPHSLFSLPGEFFLICIITSEEINLFVDHLHLVNPVLLPREQWRPLLENGLLRLKYINDV